MRTTAQQSPFGFTLIEVMVVITIMAVLLAAGIASYSKMNDRAKVEQAANELVTQLRVWQKDVDSGMKSDLCGANPYLGIRVTLSGSVVSANILCQGQTDRLHQTLDLSKYKVVIGFTPATFTHFDMHPLGRGTSSAATITVRNTAATFVYTITVTSAGGMSVVKTQ